MGNARNFKTGTFLSSVAPVLASLYHNDLAKEENASDFALVVALACGQSRLFKRLSSRHSLRVGPYNSVRVDGIWLKDGPRTERINIFIMVVDHQHHEHS